MSTTIDKPIVEHLEELTTDFDSAVPCSFTGCENEAVLRMWVKSSDHWMPNLLPCSCPPECHRMWCLCAACFDTILEAMATKRQCLICKTCNGGLEPARTVRFK